MKAELFIALVGELLGKPLEPRVLSHRTIRLISLFNARLREIRELLYQNDNDYVFDSSTFTLTFGQEPTRIATGSQRSSSGFSHG